MTNRQIPIALLVAALLAAAGIARLVSSTTRDTSSAEIINADSVPDRVRKAAALATRWLVRNATDDGWPYIYGPAAAGQEERNNEIRQLMASRLLAALAAEDSLLSTKHVQNVATWLKKWYRETPGDAAHILYNGKAKLGGAAIALRTLAASPIGFPVEAQRLANGIISLWDSENGFSPWFVEPPYPYDPDYLLSFYSGEAILALLEYANVAGDSSVFRVAQEAADYYVDRYAGQIDEHFYPAYVPWHCLALRDLYILTGEPRYADAVYTMTDRLLSLQDTTNAIGRFYNPKLPHYGSPHALSDGVYTEGLAAALDVARRAGSTRHEQRYRRALHLAVSHLLRLQIVDGSPIAVHDPEMVGALVTRHSSVSGRVDNTQHALDAFRMVLTVWR